MKAAPSNYGMRRASILVPKDDDRFSYKLEDKGDGTTYECSDLAKLLRISSSKLFSEPDERCGPFVISRVRVPPDESEG